MAVEGKSRWVQAGNINTHYLVAGEGSPVVLLHGGANDTREWKLNFDFLPQRCCVYAPDLVGYGKSDKPKIDYSFPIFIDFLYNFIKALDLKRVSLLGYSMGGDIALGFALQFPEMVQKLILVASPVMGKVSTTARLLMPIYTITGTLRVGKTFRSVVKAGSKQSVDFMERLSEIEAPTLIIWGANDRILPVTQAYIVHRMIKNASLHIFPKCGHAPQRARPEEFNRLVLDFLSSE